MSDRQDGGPAFPSSGDYCDPRGMTLRDYFAGQALAGMACLYAQAGGTSEEIAMANAEVAYLMADAMLVERGKR